MPKSKEYQRGYQDGYIECFVEVIHMLVRQTQEARKFVEIAEKKFGEETMVNLRKEYEEMN